MKVIKFEQENETVELTIEQQEYLIMAEADVEKDMWSNQLKIEMAYDIYGLDNNLRIQDITHQEEQFIYEQINERYV